MLLGENAITVSQLNAYVRETLWRDEYLRQILVRGEIANLRNYQGHLYFTLKDSKASVRAVMWRSETARLSFVPADGAEVLVAGNVSVFERDGIYQVYASYMEPSGLGALYAALERLKAKLGAEGLFSVERKRPLPAFPRRVGVVTSIRGAAIKDIVIAGRRRFPGVRFAVVDAKVQGEGAAADVIAGIQILSDTDGVDVIIVGRGGGSQEDLWVFNDEALARAIFACKKPVVSAVGHERDVSVADLVADARAATPTQAAELTVPDALGLGADVRKLAESCRTQVYALVGGYRQTLGLLRSRPALTRPDWFLVSSRETVVRLSERLERSVRGLLQSQRDRFGAASSKLDALSPLQVLGRGYSLVRSLPGGQVVTDYRLAPPGSRLSISLRSGSLECTVDGSYPPEPRLPRASGAADTADTAIKEVKDDEQR